MNVRYLALDRANTVLQFANAIARPVDDATDVAKMLKNNVVGLNHRLNLSQNSIGVTATVSCNVSAPCAECLSPAPAVASCPFHSPGNCHTCRPALANRLHVEAGQSSVRIISVRP